MDIVILNPNKPAASALFCKDREKVLKALAWYGRRSFESTEWSIKQALLRIIDHKDWEIRQAVAACITRRLDDPEFLSAVFRRLGEEKYPEVLEILVEASILPIMHKREGHAQARERVQALVERKYAGIALRRSCEMCLYWTQEITVTAEERAMLRTGRQA